MFTAGFALFAERRFIWRGAPFGPKEVGYVFMYSGFLGIFVQGAMRQGALVRKVGEVRLVTIGFLAGAAGYALLGFSFGVVSLLAAASVASFGTGVLRPALTSLITQQAQSAHHPTSPACRRRRSEYRIRNLRGSRHRRSTS